MCFSISVSFFLFGNYIRKQSSASNLQIQVNHLGVGIHTSSRRQVGSCVSGRASCSPVAGRNGHKTADHGNVRETFVCCEFLPFNEQHMSIGGRASEARCALETAQLSQKHAATQDTIFRSRDSSLSCKPIHQIQICACSRVRSSAVLLIFQCCGCQPNYSNTTVLPLCPHLGSFVGTLRDR